MSTMVSFNFNFCNFNYMSILNATILSNPHFNWISGCRDMNNSLKFLNNLTVAVHKIGTQNEGSCFKCDTDFLYRKFDDAISGPENNQ